MAEGSEASLSPCPVPVLLWQEWKPPGMGTNFAKGACHLGSQTSPALKFFPLTPQGMDTWHVLGLSLRSKKSGHYCPCALGQKKEKARRLFPNSCPAFWSI